jgi:hypothetical protein
VSDGVLDGASGDGVDVEAAGLGVLEVVEVAPLVSLPAAATVVVRVTASSDEDADPPDEHPATQNAPAASSAVTLRLLAAR